MKEKKREDRRIKRTRQALHRALSELVLEKGYAEVTVEDITTRANMGRTTFYLHYQDKEEILLEGLENNLSDLVDEISKRPLIFWLRDNNDNLIKSIFGTVKENEDIFTLITKEQSNKVYDHFRGIIVKVAMKLLDESPWAQKRIDQLAVPLDYLVDYFSGAMWASIVWWASEDFKHSTSEMVKHFRMLFFPGLLRVLNVTAFAELADTFSQ
jgi:AcrR family transcriptional regulator